MTPPSRRVNRRRFPLRVCAYTDTTASAFALPAFREMVLMSRSGSNAVST